ncbi:MAG TPA: hypothetical protein VJ885_13065 [Thermoanaerobaculia bacterium]|nr:hypothetical protein [Thermoanaerobaculia bacterium]
MDERDEKSPETFEEDYGDDDASLEEEDVWPAAPLGGYAEENGGSVSFQSGSVTAESIEVARTMIKQLNVTTIAGSVEPVRLSAQHFRLRTPDDLERCEAELVFDATEIEELRWLLEERRILVISGDPESGKGSMALLIGYWLSKALRLGGVLACQGLDSAVQVDLERIAGSNSFARHVLLFENALAGDNADLKAFLRSAEIVGLARLRERLRRNNSAIILTVASHTISESEQRLESLGILSRVAPPSQALRLEALHRFVDRWPLLDGHEKEVTALLSDSEEMLAQELKTIPRIARFVHEYLGEVVQGRLALRQALARMDDLSQWLTTDLAGHPEAQAAALSICFGSAVPPAVGIPWFSFDRLRRGITEVIRKAAHLPDDEPSPGIGRGLSLERARAQVVSMPSPLSDLVRFRDDRYTQRLWQALLNSARELATLMLPHLQELTRDPDPFLRSSAASALGRLGRIGPTHIAAPLLQQWAREDSTEEDLLGFFLQGAVASEDRAYRDFCLSQLRQLMFAHDSRVAEVAIHSLRLLGRPDVEVPLQELCVVLRARLPLQIGRLRLVEKEVLAAEQEVRRGADPRKVSNDLRLLHARSHVLMTAVIVAEERLRLLGAVQYALAGLLFSQGGDLGAVLRSLNQRMKAEPEKLAPLFAYFFLRRQGLIDLLDRHKWISGLFGTEACSRFLLSANRGAEEAGVLGEFLVRSFRALQVFPGLFRFLLEQRFLHILKSWSHEGCRVMGLRPTVTGLLSDLLSSEDLHLRRTVGHFLRAEPQFTVRGSRLRALAVDALNGGVGPVPATSSQPRRLPAWLKK